MKLPGKLLTAVFLLTLVAGCMNFDYVGQSFAPHSESVPVTFYENRAAIPGIPTGSSAGGSFRDRRMWMVTT